MPQVGAAQVTAASTRCSSGVTNGQGGSTGRWRGRGNRVVAGCSGQPRPNGPRPRAGSMSRRPRIRQAARALWQQAARYRIRSSPRNRRKRCASVSLLQEPLEGSPDARPPDGFLAGFTVGVGPRMPAACRSAMRCSSALPSSSGTTRAISRPRSVMVMRLPCLTRRRISLSFALAS